MHSTVLRGSRLAAARILSGRWQFRAYLQLPLVFCVIAGLAAGNAEAQTAKPTTEASAAKKPGAKTAKKPVAKTPKGTKPAKPGAKTAKKGQQTPAPAAEPTVTPPANDFSPEDPTASGPTEPAFSEPATSTAESAPASAEPTSVAEPVIPPSPAPTAPAMEPAPYAPATNPAPAAAALTGDPTVSPSTGSNVPATSRFEGPDPSRPLPPPSGLASLDDPLSGPDSIEQSVNVLLSEAVVTTAGKRDQRLQDVPLTVAWIPAEELEGTGAFSLCEAIQYFPGMECRRGPMRKVAVSARGLGSNFLSNRLLLLKDGRPLTDPWTGQFYADETTPMTNLKQVEVIRGPGSSLYGSNAFSGVINIIERQPSDLIGDKQNVGFDGRVLAGQFNTYRVQATAAGRGGPVEALASYYGFSSDGAALFSDPTVGREDDNQHSLVHQVSGKVKAGVFSMDADFTDAEIGRPGGTQISTVGNCGRCHYTAEDVERVQNLNAAAHVDMQVADNVRVFAQGYAFFKRRVVDLRNEITNEMQPVLGKRRRFGGEARALVTAGDLSITFGGDVKDDQVNNQNILPGLTLDDTVQTIIGGFVDAEYRPMSRLVLSAGARYDNYQIPARVWANKTDQISPRASIVFHAMPDLTLRTNYGRAFRAPTLAELAINQQMYAATLLGSSDLRAETLDTFEAAVDYWPFDRRVRLTGTAFYNLAKNFINQELIFGSTSQFRNVGDARVTGFELEAAAQIPSANSSFDVAYQFLNANALPYGGGPSSVLDYAPKHRLYARARTNLGKTAFAEVYGLYVSSRYDPGFLVNEQTGETRRLALPGYVSASARVGMNVTSGLSVSLLGTNLFDSQYEESHGFPAPGRGVFSEIKFRY
ncbi:MAG TPA: TonB-dependent receptor [Myxococcaceae bacterium]